MQVQTGACRFERLPDSSFAPARERTDVGARVDRVRPEFLGEPAEFVAGVALADDESTAALLQRVVEIPEAFEHELGPRPRAVTTVKQTGVETEDGNHRLGGVERRGQGWVVGEPQVAAEPDDRRRQDQTGGSLPSSRFTAAWR